jgi:hypothetical protein
MGIHGNTLCKLEKGKSVSTLTRMTVEQHLGWEPGSMIEIARGGRPTIDVTVKVRRGSRGHR